MGNNNENININNTEVNENVELANNDNTTTDVEVKDSNGKALLIGAGLATAAIVLIEVIVWGVKKLIGVFKRKKADRAETTDAEEIKPGSEQK